MCGWMFPLGVWGAGWYCCNFSNIFWRSPLHCEKIVCCDVRCERRGLWKTSVTCTTICSQIDRGVPFSVYPSSAPHHGPLHTPVATLPGTWLYRVNAGTGWPSVSVLWLGEVESLICNFYLCVAARKLLWADLSLRVRYTSILLGR